MKVWHGIGDAAGFHTLPLPVALTSTGGSEADAEKGGRSRSLDDREFFHVRGFWGIVIRGPRVSYTPQFKIRTNIILVAVFWKQSRQTRSLWTRCIHPVTSALFLRGSRINSFPSKRLRDPYPKATNLWDPLAELGDGIWRFCRLASTTTTDDEHATNFNTHRLLASGWSHASSNSVSVGSLLLHHAPVTLPWTEREAPCGSPPVGRTACLSIDCSGYRTSNTERWQRIVRERIGLRIGNKSLSQRPSSLETIPLLQKPGNLQSIGKGPKSLRQAVSARHNITPRTKKPSFENRV